MWQFDEIEKIISAPYDAKRKKMYKKKTAMSILAHTHHGDHIHAEDEHKLKEEENQAKE